MVWRLNRAEPQVSDTRAPVEHHLDGLGGQAAADVGEEPPADQRATLGAHVGAQRRAGGGLVVEGREHQAVVAGVDQQSGQHRDAGADRQAAGRPGDGIGEDVAFDAELHGQGPNGSSSRGSTGRSGSNPAMLGRPGGGRGGPVVHQGGGPSGVQVDVRISVEVGRSHSVGGNCGQGPFAQVGALDRPPQGLWTTPGPPGDGCAPRRAAARRFGRPVHRSSPCSSHRAVGVVHSASGPGAGRARVRCGGPGA